MTKPELLRFAAKHGIPVGKSFNKQRLIADISAYFNMQSNWQKLMDLGKKK